MKTYPTRTYFYTSPVFALRDKPEPLGLDQARTNNKNQSMLLEQYLNDLYHHFLDRLTTDMQSPVVQDEDKLKSLLDEILKTKKLLQEIG